MVSVVVWVLGVVWALLVGLATYGWRHRSSPGVRWFVALEVTAAVWVAVTIRGLLLPPGPFRLRLWGLGTGLSLVTIVLWFGFIVAYTGRREWLEPRRFALIAAPLVAGAVVYAVAPTWPPLMADTTQLQRSVGTVVAASIGPLGGVLGLFVYGTFFAGFLLAFRTVSERDSLLRGQVVAFVLGTSVPVVASAVRTLGLGPPGFPTTQVALGLQSLLWGYAVFRQQFLRQVPSVSRIGERRAFETIEDGVFVLDDRGVVVRANRRAAEVVEADAPVGKSLEALFDAVGGPELAEFPAEFRHSGRVYEVIDSPVTDWRDQRIGRTVVVRDVTRLVTRQQRLEVLTRILRHNVRNDMTVVQGSAIEIRQLVDGRAETLARRIETRSTDLLSTSEKGRDVERLFDSSGEAWVDAAAFVDELLAGPPGRYPEATVTASVAVEEFETDRNALSLVVTELVGNALEHGGDAPTVELSVTRHADGVRVVVADDGPGIPDSELEPVRDGEESSLRHGSGIGLWLVNWGARTLGADLSFDVDDGGTTVSLSLPETPVSDRPAQVRRAE